jgi:hypothetical protein
MIGNENQLMSLINASKPIICESLGKGKTSRCNIGFEDYKSITEVSVPNDSCDIKDYAIIKIKGMENKGLYVDSSMFNINDWVESNGGLVPKNDSLETRLQKMNQCAMVTFYSP